MNCALQLSHETYRATHLEQFRSSIVLIDIESDQEKEEMEHETMMTPWH